MKILFSPLNQETTFSPTNSILGTFMIFLPLLYINPHQLNSSTYSSLCSNIKCWRSALTGLSFKHFANFIQKEKNKNFSKCCALLGVNMTAVLTSGSFVSRQLSERAVDCWTYQTESVHEQSVLELLQDESDTTALFLWIVSNHKLSAGWIWDLGMFPAFHYSRSLNSNALRRVKAPTWSLVLVI